MLGAGLGMASLMAGCAFSGSPAPDQTRSANTSSAPSLADYWEGTAEWELEIDDTGLPFGESDTIIMPGGEWWAFLHASAESAGVVDSCGEAVEFPGCVTRWVSRDGGRSFSLPDNTCLLACNACPCNEDDLIWQQQYPRVAQSPDSVYYLAFENNAAAWVSQSVDGLHWSRPRSVDETGIWTRAERGCTDAQDIGIHPAFEHEKDCMAGGPPGVYADARKLYIFVGLGQSPGHMGCYWAYRSAPYRFRRCFRGEPLLSGASEYGPLGLLGSEANPFFDFRFVTSADVIAQDGYFYMTYEGIRGPYDRVIGRDNQFGLGFARSPHIESTWEKHPGNPALGGLADNWGVGHADLLEWEGVTYLITGTSEMTRGRYRLVWQE